MIALKQGPGPVWLRSATMLHSSKTIEVPRLSNLIGAENLGRPYLLTKMVKSKTEKGIKSYVYPCRWFYKFVAAV